MDKVPGLKSRYNTMAPERKRKYWKDSMQHHFIDKDPTIETYKKEHEAKIRSRVLENNQEPRTLPEIRL
jgi:hypothetical protein